MFTNLHVVDIFHSLSHKMVIKVWSVLERLTGYSILKLVGEETHESRRIHQRLIRPSEFKAQDP